MAQRSYLDLLPKRNNKRTVDELLPTYDAARFMQDNYKPNDQAYNIGYLLGTLWGNNYNKRGEKKSMETANAMLHDEQAKMKGLENEGQRAERVFDLMKKQNYSLGGKDKLDTKNAIGAGMGKINPEQLDVLNIDVANSALKDMVAPIGEYADPKKFEGYVSKLEQNPAQKIAEPSNDFRAEKFIPELVKKLEADGRTDYQINHVLNKLRPEITQMDKDAKQGTAFELVRDFMGENGYVDLSDPNVINKMSDIYELNPTAFALLMRTGSTKAEREDKEFDRNYKTNALYYGRGGSGTSEEKRYLATQSPEFKAVVERAKVLQGLEDRTIEEEETLEELQQYIRSAFMHDGINTTDDLKRYTEFENSRRPKDLDDYNQTTQYVNNYIDAMRGKGYQNKEIVGYLLNRHGDRGYVRQVLEDMNLIPKNEKALKVDNSDSLQKNDSSPALFGDWNSDVNPETGYAKGSIMDKINSKEFNEEDEKGRKRFAK